MAESWDRWLSPQAFRSRALLEKLRDAYQGRRCFVIGNGPSLRVEDLRKLKHEITIGCNGIFLIFEQIGYKPTVYTIEDQVVAEDRAKEVNELSGPAKILPLDLMYCLRQTPGTAFVNFLRNYEDFPKFSDDFARQVYWGGTVTFMNLQLAYFLGCREIYLMGIDHNYKVPSYADGPVITSQEADSNHFHPGYFGPGYRYHDPKVERMEQAYNCALQFANRHSFHIYNATRGGKLEVFPRVDFDGLFPAKGN